MSNLHHSDDRIQKSLKRRFLSIIGVLFFLVYLALGLMIIFWKSLPLDALGGFRTFFGVLLIVYAFIRFLRLLKRNPS